MTTPLMADPLSATFAALADPTRRAILARLAQGDATVGELARPFDMSLPGVSKHLKVLRDAGLVTQGRDAQWRPCHIEPARLQRRLVVDRAVPAPLGGPVRTPRRLPSRTPGPGGTIR